MKKEKASPSCAARTAVAYARYSSAGQRDVSIDQQLQDIRAFARREGYTIVHEYADHARSGFKRTDARSEFQAMMAAADKGSFDTVIAWKVDRFGRNREESAIFKGRLRQRGVRVVYAMEPIPDGAAGVLLEGMLEATAEWYSRNLSENVSRGMTDNAKKCLWNGAQLYGFRKGPGGSFEIVEEEAALIRRMFELYLQGYSFSRVADALNADGLRTPRGNLFDSSFVKRIINNDRYKGVYRWGDYVTPDGIPAIISKSDFERAQTMKNKTARHVNQGGTDYLLTGKAFCGVCGAPLIGDSGTSHTGATHNYYTCRDRKNKKSCTLKTCRKEELENAVIDFIFDYCLTGEVKEKIADHVVAAQAEALKKSPLAGMEKELAATRRKIDNINNAIAEGFASATTAVKLRDLETVAEELRVSVESLRYSEKQLITRDRVLFFLEKLATMDKSDPIRQKQLINTFINSVTLYPDGSLRIVINTIEGVSLIPINLLPEPAAPPPRSDSGARGVLVSFYPNPETLVFVVSA